MNKFFLLLLFVLSFEASFSPLLEQRAFTESDEDSLDKCTNTTNSVQAQLWLDWSYIFLQ